MKKFLIGAILVLGFVAGSFGGSLLADPGDGGVTPHSIKQPVELADPGDAGIKPYRSFNA